MKFKCIGLSLLFFLGLHLTETHAQDLEPRFLSNMPIGGNFIVAAYGFSNGNILVDNTLPIDDLNANINSATIGYANSFKLFNRLAKFDVVSTYAFANYQAVVSNIDTSRIDNGFVDPMIRVSLILIGARAYTPAEYVKNIPEKFRLGVLIRVRAPLGKYEADKLLNLGTNRWGVKFGLASTYDFSKKLKIEGQVNMWVFTANDNFYNGNTIKQAPMLSVQLHMTYVFKPGLWLAVSLGQSGLGRTSINDVEQSQNQNNSRLGLAFAYRVGKHNALKIAYTSGVSTRYGADFNTVLLAYQFMWFDK